MLTFTNTKYTKAQAIAMMQEHKRLDAITAGTYGAHTNEKWQGCLVGCAAQGNHQDFEPFFGIPRALAFLADTILEALDKKIGIDFAAHFFDNIPEGLDISRGFDKFFAWELGDPSEGLITTSSEPSVKSMADLFIRAAAGDETTKDEFDAAACAAWAARDARALKQRDKLLEILAGQI